MECCPRPRQAISLARPLPRGERPRWAVFPPYDSGRSSQGGPFSETTLVRNSRLNVTVEWKFKAHVAEGARSFRFHPSQTVKDEPDGSVTVTFSASGLTEMVWHLFTWGDVVEIVK